MNIVQQSASYASGDERPWLHRVFPSILQQPPPRHWYEFGVASWDFGHNASVVRMIRFALPLAAKRSGEAAARSRVSHSISRSAATRMAFLAQDRFAMSLNPPPGMIERHMPGDDRRGPRGRND